MNQAIKVVILLIIASLFSGWLWHSHHDLIDECGHSKTLNQDQRQSCNQRITKLVKEALSGSHPVTIDIPEHDAKVTLNKMQSVHHRLYLRGDYQLMLREATAQQEALYDKGVGLLNLAKVTLLNRQQGPLLYFAAPFVINVAGSGVFFYVGLFSYDLNTQLSDHVDSLFLGDRILDEHIELIHDGLRISFLQHGEHQSLSEYPNHRIEKKLQLLNLFQTNSKAKFNEVKPMHHRVDTDRDGSNDCKNDGSCDHSVDDSQPHPAS
ncbi:hypothetical protein [Psychromonas sp. MME2]|uniref:hypothetical protein n=1 Tax=unclassified Psychromonas TaxID=2614957 RepID=UPI00339C5F6D